MVARFLLKVTFPEEVPFTINEVPFIVATLPEVTSKLLIDKLPVSVTSDVMYALLEELALEIFGARHQCVIHFSPEHALKSYTGGSKRRTGMGRTHIAP